MYKKRWEKPNLIVLVRARGELVLMGCKTSEMGGSSSRDRVMPVVACYESGLSSCPRCDSLWPDS